MRFPLRSFSPSLLGLALIATACDHPHDPAPTVAMASVVRGTLTLTSGDDAEVVHGPTRVETSAIATTASDGRGALSLDSGAWVLLDRDTTVQVELASATLSTGRVWVDASSADETTLTTSGGSLVAHGASGGSGGAAFAVSIEDGATVVYCGSGEVTYHATNGEGTLAQGETLRIDASGTPTVAPEAMWDDWTGGLADPASGRLRSSDPVGTLAGRTTAELGEARTSLPVRSHEVNVEIRNDLAFTEVMQTFFNARSDTLEGEWSIRIPEGAIVSGFAVDTGNGFADSTIGSVAVGSGYQLSWSSADLAESRLTYDGPNRLRARIYPVAPGATVRVRLRYTEWLDRSLNRRTYVYPMRSDGEPPLLGEFLLSVDTRAAGASGLRAGMGARYENGRVTLRVSDYRPHADFYLDLYDPPDAEVGDVVAYPVSGDAPSSRDGTAPAEGTDTYVLFDVPTDALLADEATEQPPLELVVVLDVSGATDTEDLELGRAIVEAALRQLAPTDRIALLLSDVTAHRPSDAPEGLVEPSDENREAFLESLSRVDLGGATDLGESLRQAAALVSGHPRGAVLYLGDALPTTGGLDATSLRATLATIDAPPRFFGLAIGDGANIELLKTLFGGEQAEAVREREAASRTMMRLLAEAGRPTLRGLSIDLGEGIERVFPRAPLEIGEGAHLRLVGRQVGDIPTSVTLRATRDGQPIETTIAVRRDAVSDDGDVRRRWASARLAELLDEDAGREALVDLGTRFSIITPWTSLLVDGHHGDSVPLVTNFDEDPLIVPWALGGGTSSVPITSLASDDQGWRRRMASVRTEEEIATAPESTWSSHTDGYVPSTSSRPVVGPYGADGGLGRAAVERALREGERGPRQCYDRRSIVRPDLTGNVGVSVTVSGDGTVRETSVTSSTLGDPETEACMLGEIRGLRFAPPLTTQPIIVTYVYQFILPEREFGSRRTCSDAAYRSLEVRRRLWRERLSVQYGVSGALEVYRQARARCELQNWRARRTIIDLMMRHVGGLSQRIDLYRALASDPAAASYLRNAILRSVRTPEDVAFARTQLGLEVQVDWNLFARGWSQSDVATARLALVRRWLAVVPDDMDLRVRLLALLEETNGLPEARRLARSLREDPLADARVRTLVGEFWLRQEDEAEARRVFSEIVEHTPYDPWSRRRLGDLYRAHGWPDDAYREYQTLARLRPGELEVLLLMSRAAAGAGRTDEALRLEQRLSESTDPGVDEGAATYARLWTMVRLMRLADGSDAETGAAVRRRLREAGVLRDPPDIFVALSFDHPDDIPRFSLHYPGIEDANAFEEATLGGTEHGILAFRIREREEGAYQIDARREDRESLRDITAELMIVIHPGAADARVIRQDVVLSRTEWAHRYELSADDTLHEIPIPAPRTTH
jgi:Ca-activated chloride channel family protein